MKTAVIVYPGSNCDRDAAVALEKVTGRAPMMVWHKNSSLPEKLDFIVVPGGFSYGDYLRSGAIAARSPITKDLINNAKSGIPVLGVCNGFQVLTETKLLPGTLLPNANRRFICEKTDIYIVSANSRFTHAYKNKRDIRVPIAHRDGNFYADKDTLDALEGDGCIAFRYHRNPNGSQRDIAGILNQNGNILGMMPHPERAIDTCHGGRDGLALFESILGALSK